MCSGFAQPCTLACYSPKAHASMQLEGPFAAALRVANGAVFAISALERRKWLLRSLGTLGLNGSAVHLLAPVRAASYGWDVLASLARCGILNGRVWNHSLRLRQRDRFSPPPGDTLTGTVLNPSRMAVLLSHQLAQQAFLESQYQVGIFLEDDVVLTLFQFWKMFARKYRINSRSSC